MEVYIGITEVILKQQLIKVTILGAGPAGLSAAWRLSQDGRFQVNLIEAAKTVGGSAKTFDLWGYPVDIGPHRFSTENDKVLKFWESIIGADYLTIVRKTRIFFDDTFVDYPIRFKDLFDQLGAIKLIGYSLSFLKAQIFSHQDANSMEEWLKKKYGNALYKKFFLEYSQKLWGLPPAELNSEFAQQRIQNLSAFDIVKKILLKKTSGVRSFHTTFKYPCEGNGAVYERLHAQLAEKGVETAFNTKVVQIEKRNGHIFRLITDKQVAVEADYVISTIPLPAFTSLLFPEDQEIGKTLGKLCFRNTRLVYLLVKDFNEFQDQWIYIQSARYKVGRITNFRNWNSSLYKNTGDAVLCMEYWGWKDDPLMVCSDKDLTDIAISELQALFPGNFERVRESFVLQVPDCYPVYYRGYKNDLSLIKKQICKVGGAFVIGRYGSYTYTNQDQSIEMGLAVADFIRRGDSHAEKFEEKISQVKFFVK